MKIIKKFTFDAAHRLWNNAWDADENLKIYGKCTRLHGHTYHLSVVISGENSQGGMIINFSELSRIIKENIIERYDHSFLNELKEFENQPTTSENIAKEIFIIVQKLLPNVTVEEVRLSETPTSEAIITKDSDLR